MNWYLQSSEKSDVAKNTKIKFARNVHGIKFNLNTLEEIKPIEEKIQNNLYNIGYGLRFFKLRDMDNVTKMSLVEKGLITKEFVKNKSQIGSILINDDENICIMIGNEDHLEIQVFNCGLDLEAMLNLAIELDKNIEKVVGYAVSKKYGYLTACPTNVGTGLKASVVVHLPGLTKTRNTRKILSAISNFGINIVSLSGENQENYSCMYQISNNQTLGISENEIIQNLKIVVEQIIEEERKARRMLAKNEIELEDIIYRSYGILSNCKKISSSEAEALLSDIKLGTDLGILKELNDLQVQKLYLYTKPANLQKYLGEKCDKAKREIKRAEVIKQIIANRDVD